MKKIEKWQDVEPFKGKIVAYCTNYSFYLSQNGCSFSDKQIRYGYINEGLGDWLACDGAGNLLYPNNHHKGRGWGYGMHQLIASEIRSFTYKPLVDFRFKEAHLEIRQINLDELICIHEYVKKRWAYFEGSNLFEAAALKSLQRELCDKGLTEADLSKHKIA